MKSAVLPAILLFGLSAAGLMVVRDYLAAEPAAPETIAAAELVAAPAEAPLPPPRSGKAVLRKEKNGHFWVTADVNGYPVRMMVDTGSSVVVLTPEDARRAGFDPDSLPRTAQANTAAGQVATAPVTLKRIKIDGLEARDVAAVVMDDSLRHSLLGMSFLTQLSGWQVTEGAMVLRQ